MELRNTYDTEDLWEKDKDHYIHPWSDFSVFHEEGSLVVAEADGVHVYDSDGKQYIDGIGGLWCVNIGYGSSEMADAIAEQVRTIPYYSVFSHITTPPAAQLASKLSEIAPGSLNHVFYGTGGSMANDTAVRIIHHYNNLRGKESKKKIISRTDAYHGSTFLAMALTGVEFDHTDFDHAQGLVHYVSSPNPYRKPEEMSDAEFCNFLVAELEEKINELGADNVAAFIAEPIMGAGGVIVPPDGYHKRTLEVCKQYDVLYISDEVVTGFGRLGHMLASEPVFDIVPDMITCAKGITSGYLPLSATMISDEIYDVISRPMDDGRLFTHGFTYSGHPVCCASALKNIEIIERDKICEHVQSVGPYFEEQLKTLTDLPIVGDVRGKCFMMCVENVANAETKELFDESLDIGKRITKHCQKHGLIIRPLAHLNILSPPLTLTHGQIDEIVRILRLSIEAAMVDLEKEGIKIAA